MKKIEISISSLIKAVIIMAIGVLLILPTAVFATTGKSTGNLVNVREKPTTDSDVVEQLGSNDVVEILGKEGDWYKVNFQGTIGYVSQSFISTNDNSNGNNNSNTSNEQKNEVKNDENKATESTENTTQTVTTVTKAYKMAEDCKVKILPVINAEEIGDVKKGENVSLSINAGLWAYIETASVSGWVRIDKLSAEDVVVTEVKEEQKTTDENKSQTTAIETKKMYASSAAVNVRSEANTTSDIVDSIELNTEVTAIGEENGWYKVQVNGSTGYIRKDLVSTEKTEVSSRSNQLDRTAAQEANVQSSASNVPVSSSGVTGSDIAAYAQQFVGCSYVYATAGPNTFDCSGLTSYVYKHFGYNLSRSSRDQALQGVEVTGDLQPGDILVFSNDGKQVGHVGIYIGNDKFVHASDPSTGVIISNLHDKCNINKYWGARRIIQ